MNWVWKHENGVIFRIDAKRHVCVVQKSRKIKNEVDYIKTKALSSGVANVL